MSTTPTPTPAGIYRLIPSAEYHALNLPSASYLKALNRCPAAAKTGLPPSPALDFGTAFHAIMDGTFEETCAVAPEGDKRTKEGKAAWEQFQAANAGKVVVSASDMAKLYAMRRAVENHPEAGRIVSASGESELTVIWVEPTSGLLCKSRMDWVLPGVIVDFKTCCSAESGKFLKSVVDFGYAVQAAFYMDAMASVGVAVEDFQFVAVEKDAPHRVEVYSLSQEFLAWGRSEYRRLLQVELSCREANHWPAYKASGVVELGLPAWLKGGAA